MRRACAALQPGLQVQALRNGVRATTRPFRSTTTISMRHAGARQRLGGRAPGGLGDERRHASPGLVRPRQHLVGGVGGQHLPRQRLVAAGLAHPLGQPAEVDAAPPRMQVEQALPELASSWRSRRRP